MTVLLRTLRACLRRAVFSVNFITAVFAAFSVLALESTGLYTQGGDVLYYLGLALNGGSAAVLMVCVFSTLPFSTSFATDWTERSFRFWSVRCGLRVYALTKIAACAVSGFLTSFLGMSLFTAAFCARFPLFSSPSVGNAYSVYLIHGRPCAYLLLLKLTLTAGLLALLGWAACRRLIRLVRYD